MGVLDVFKRKKADEFALNPEAQMNWQEQPQQYSSPDAGRDYAYGSPQDPYGQMQHSNYPMQDSSTPSFSPEQAGFDRIRERDSYSSRQNQSVSDINIGKDLELINAKLDAIKSELDSVNQRLKRMERINEGVPSEKPNRDPWQY